MARVCLDCGTPKLALREHCQVCNETTITHEGEARKPLCLDCRQFRDGHCHVWNDNVAGRMASKLEQRAARHAYQCQDFRHNPSYPYVAFKPSRNPLERQAITEIKNFREFPEAFWNDPSRWDHVEDPRKELFWDKPKPRATAGQQAGAAAVVGTIGIVGALLTKRQKTG